MKTRYRIIRRGNRGDTFYCVDAQTRKRTGLNTSDLKAARRIVEAKNQAEEQPAINRQLAKAYAKRAQVTLPPLEDYERNATAAPVIPLPVSITG